MTPSRSWRPPHLDADQAPRPHRRRPSPAPGRAGAALRSPGSPAARGGQMAARSATARAAPATAPRSPRAADRGPPSSRRRDPAPPRGPTPSRRPTTSVKPAPDVAENEGMAAVAEAAVQAPQPPPRETSLMGCSPGCMMGLAIWHFTIWLPDRFWGGIVGAFVGALIGAVLFGLDHPRLLDPGASRHRSGHRARGDSRRADRHAAIWFEGVRRERVRAPGRRRRDRSTALRARCGGDSGRARYRRASR